jgi:hypothetical protein
MGPQPLGPVKQPAPEMMQTIDRLLNALIAGDKDTVRSLSDDNARDQMSQIADAVPRGAFSEAEILGKARVVEHYFIKARLLGANDKKFLFQFRIGPDGGKWTVREAVNLTGMRSAWTK